MATVQDDKESGVGRKAGDKVSMKGIGIELSILAEINWADSIQKSGWMVSSGILDLSTMTRVVKEISSSRLTDQPVYCGLWEWSADSLAKRLSAGHTSMLWPEG